jgi:hypothetical protein
MSNSPVVPTSNPYDCAADAAIAEFDRDGQRLAASMTAEPHPRDFGGRPVEMVNGWRWVIEGPHNREQYWRQRYFWSQRNKTHESETSEPENIGWIPWHPVEGWDKGTFEADEECLFELIEGWKWMPVYGGNEPTPQKACETRPATAGASLIVSAEQAKDPLAFRHWSKDFLVPYVGCHCSTCVAASSSSEGEQS